MSCIITYNGQNFTQEDFLDYLKSQIPTSINNPSDFTNHSGGAKGGDTVWDQVGREFGVTNHNHYTVTYYDTLIQKEKNQLQEQYISTVNFLKRGVIGADTYSGKLVRRDMIQANNGDAIFGITELVKPNTKGRKGYVNKTNYSIPEGGTGYAVARGIILNKPTYVFNQSDSYGNEIGWYVWDNSVKDFVKTDTPTLTNNFTGIGSQEINDLGKQAIRDVYEKTFKKQENSVPLQDKAINIYAGTNENSHLSNFATRPFVLDVFGNNERFNSVEQYFQYSKWEYVKDELGYNEEVAEKILDTKSPSKAKALGRTFKDLDIQRWNTNSSAIMKRGLLESFKQNPEALEQLLNTKDSILTHNQDKGKWGKEFPKLLMEVREELKPKSNVVNTLESKVNKVNSSLDKYGYVDVLDKNNKDFKLALIKYIVKQLDSSVKTDEQVNAYIIKEKKEGRSFDLKKYVNLEEMGDKTRVKLNLSGIIQNEVESPISLGGLNFTSSGRDFESKNIFKNNIEQAFNCK